MICPFCEHNDDKVIDSRASDGGRVVRRRRQCLRCKRRFTTYERVEETARLTVIKRDGTREPFDREKVLRGVQAACGKRPIPEDAKISLVDAVEEEVHQEFDREAPSRIIGEKVMAKLRGLDEVAYVRFASEHHRFETAGDIAQEVEELRNTPKDVKSQRPLFE